MSNNKGFFGSLASALVESQHEIRMAEREQLNKLWVYLKTNHPNFVTGLGLEKSNISLTQFYKKVLKIFIDDPDYPEIQSLLLKTGQHYFAAKYINKPYTLDNLEEIKILLAKKKELQDLIVKIEKNSNEKSFDDFESFKVLSRFIDELDFSTLEDSLVDVTGVRELRGKLTNLRDEFFKEFSVMLLQELSEKPTNKDLHFLFKDTLNFISRPDPSYYESFLISLLNQVTHEPTNQELKDFLMYALNKAPGIDGVSSLNIYNAVLKFFENSPLQKDLRVLVLDVGRWHFSRKNWLRRSPKPEDEQQMQNDILMRLRN